MKKETSMKLFKAAIAFLSLTVSPVGQGGTPKTEAHPTRDDIRPVAPFTPDKLL